MWDWLFSSPHPIWHWILIGAGLLALGMGIMTYLQSRNPKIFIVYDTYYNNRQENFLVCGVGNLPIGKYSSWFRIYRRTAEGVHIMFSIQDTKTNKMIATDIKASDTISIPASNEPEYCFKVVFAKDEFIKSYDHFNGQNINLPMGEYLAIIKIDTAGKKMEYRKKFSVGNKKEDIHWESM